MKLGAVNGFDVSHYNGFMDFERMSAEGHKFCFVKATEGTSFVDPQFQRNWTEAPKNQLFVGAYHFFRPQQDVNAQIDLFLRVIGARRLSDLPPVIDFESTGDVRISVQKNNALMFLTAVEQALKITPIFYSYKAFIEGLGDMSAFQRYPLWLAEYRRNVIQPENWPTPYKFWQYSAGESNGTGFDLNVFNGDLDGLRALAQLS